eukprot:6186666-Pleurochrysis_carterae.AAC.2
MEEVDKNLEEVIFDRLHEVAFVGTPLSRTILGPVENIKSITSDDIVRFVKTHYTAPRMVVAASGAVDHDELVKARTHARLLTLSRSLALPLSLPPSLPSSLSPSLSLSLARAPPLLLSLNRSVALPVCLTRSLSLAPHLPSPSRACARTSFPRSLNLALHHARAHQCAHMNLHARARASF